MCLLLLPSPSACRSLPSAHPASCLSASNYLIFVCVFLINQKDVFAAETATSKASVGSYFSRRVSAHPVADDGLRLGQRENGGHHLRPPGALWPELTEECSEQK